MIVSNFELLVKRLAPNSPLRRVVQGYFLNVTNLENRKIGLSLTFTISLGNGNRRVQNNNVQSAFDNGLIDNNVLQILPNTPPNTKVLQYRTGGFTLEPLQTGLITLLPNLDSFIGAGGVIADQPDLEIRGFTELKQRRVNGIRNIFSPVPEAKILVTPELKGTFLPNLTGDPDFDQLAYSLPTASGKAENVVEAIPAVTIPSLLGPVVDIPEFRKLLLKENPTFTTEEIEAVIDMLIEMKANPNLQAVLDKIKIG